MSEPQRAVGGAVQREHVQPDGLAHASHLTVAPLVDRNLERTAAVDGQPPHARGRAADAGLELDASGQTLELALVGRRVDAHTVDLLDAVARVHQVVRQLAVVREQQQSARVGVEAPDRKQATPRRQEFADRAAALGIVERGDDADRLVEREVAKRGRHRQRSPGDLDPVAAGLDLRPELAHDLAVDANATFLDQLVTFAARAEPALGKQLVESNAQASVRSADAGWGVRLVLVDGLVICVTVHHRARR
jgi:hypothetical protein